MRILSEEAEITDRAVKFTQQSLEIYQYRGGLTNYLQAVTRVYFDALCREVTIEFYENEFGPTREGCQSVPLQNILEMQE